MSKTLTVFPSLSYQLSTEITDLLSTVFISNGQYWIIVCTYISYLYFLHYIVVLIIHGGIIH